MSNTTKYYVVIAQSAIDFRTLCLGFGQSEAEAWHDATGGRGFSLEDLGQHGFRKLSRRNRQWFCRECDEEFFYSQGDSGRLLWVSKKNV